MKLPPAWKIRREMYRIREQVTQALLGNLYDPPRKLVHDLTLPWRLAIRGGHRAYSDKLALVVLFQPRGLARSTFLTFDHLISQGYTPVAVSNAALNDADVSAISARSALIVERPNAGYDFGAYRDGLRVLAERGVTAQKLVLLNDSTWFPLRESDDTLSRMEGLGADFSGHIFKTESAGHPEHDHVESHLMMFSDIAQASDAYRAFWAGYVMSDRRALTIARGEKRLTRTMRAAGLKIRTLLSREQFVQTLEGLDDGALHTALSETVNHREDAAAFCTDLLRAAKDGAPWRQSFVSWVDRELQSSRQHLLSVAFVAPAMRHGGLGFVKKDKDRRHHLARMRVQELETAGAIAPLHPDVRAEIRAATAGWTPPRDWRSSPNGHA
ncbi:MAG: rhamnan synthesis F family protein [Alkalilacustris sp.]